jgi:hypothetical protein
MALKAPALIARDSDYAEWTREQAEILRSRQWDALDLEELIEELDLVANSELAGLESSLARVVEHLLKLEYGARAEPRRGRHLSVSADRQNARRRLKRSPSLRGKIDLPDVYADASELAALSFAMHDDAGPSDLPRDCPYTLDRILDRGWWPANRHGLPAGPGEG